MEMVALSAINVLLSVVIFFPAITIVNRLFRERFFLPNKYRKINTALLLMFFSICSYSAINLVFFAFVYLGSDVEAGAIGYKCLVQSVLLNMVVWTFAYFTDNI